MSGTILLADDSLTIQKVVELTFADTDHRVVAVSSGDELLDRLGDTGPDLIICDVIMPGKDGYEVCQQIKSSPEWLHLPVILLTGTFEPFDRDRAIAAGCSEIITKPFEARKLVETVERLIGSSDQPPTAAVKGSPSAGDESPVTAATATAVVSSQRARVTDDDAVEDFGTQIAGAATADEEGLEFTTSGFDEMEAASHKTGGNGGSDDGIEYDLETPPEDLEDTSPSAEQPPIPDLSAQTIKIDTSSVSIEPQGGHDVPSPETTAAEVGIVEGAVSETEDSTASDADAGAVADVDGEPIEAEVDAGDSDEERSMADTSPVDPPPDESTGPVAGPVEGLSDEDVDRIARQMLELASDRLEQIAWEIVPDMAEIIVRQRVRELEAEAEAAASDTVQ